MPWWFAAISFVFFLILFLIIAKVRSSLGRIKQTPGFSENGPIRPAGHETPGRQGPTAQPTAKPERNDPFSVDMNQFSSNEFDTDEFNPNEFNKDKPDQGR